MRLGFFDQLQTQAKIGDEDQDDGTEGIKIRGIESPLHSVRQVDQRALDMDEKQLNEDEDKEKGLLDDLGFPASAFGPRDRPGEKIGCQKQPGLEKGQEKKER